jgi:hypothetical protein
MKKMYVAVLVETTIVSTSGEVTMRNKLSHVVCDEVDNQAELMQLVRRAAEESYENPLDFDSMVETSKSVIPQDNGDQE